MLPPPPCPPHIYPKARPPFPPPVPLRHPMIKSIKDRVDLDPKDPTALSVARLLFDSALLESGFSPSDPKDMSRRLMNVLMKDSLGLKEEDMTVRVGL